MDLRRPAEHGADTHGHLAQVKRPRWTFSGATGRLDFPSCIRGFDSRHRLHITAGQSDFEGQKTLARLTRDALVTLTRLRGVCWLTRWSEPLSGGVVCPIARRVSGSWGLAHM